MTVTLEQLNRLYLVADEDRPPPDHRLYVQSRRSVAKDLAGRILLAPGQDTKHLLYGARGGGKSSQLYEVARRLSDRMTLVGIDLDRSGVSIAGISAFDLLFIIGLGSLGHLRDDKIAGALHEDLTRAYTNDDPDEQKALGRLDEALPGVAGFGDAVIAAATALALSSAPGALVVAGVKMTANVLKLRSKPPGLISAASPQGRRLQLAAEHIFAAVRTKTGRPIAVLIDGLEKINGAAAQWIRNVFENTRLLTDTSVTMVVASPPCPFGDTNSASQVGWAARVVYGFAPDDYPSLEEALCRRVEFVGIDPEASGLGAICARLARDAGGHPRHAMLLLRSAVGNAVTDQRTTVTPADVQAALQELRENLAMGLVNESYATLREVERTHGLPGNDIAMKLFSDGRILVHPPTTATAHSFHAHPLLLPWIPPAPPAAPEPA